MVEHRRNIRVNNAHLRRIRINHEAGVPNALLNTNEEEKGDMELLGNLDVSDKEEEQVPEEDYDPK